MPILVLLLVAALAQQPPVPQPFPRPGTPSEPRPTAPPAQPPSTPGEPAAPRTTPPSRGTPPSTPATSAPAAARPSADTAPTQEMLGVPVYPGSQFIASYDAGRGQRYYLFGSTASFVSLVAYYRTILKKNGDEVVDVPATHTFETGRFRSETMAFPPSVTIKDFQNDVSQGYPNPKPGATPPYFPSIIQIVPATGEQ